MRRKRIGLGELKGGHPVHCMWSSIHNIATAGTLCYANRTTASVLITHWKYDYHLFPSRIY